VLSADDLGKRFGPRWIFRQLELRVEPGQVLAVVGRNGSGKSTLLKVLAGLIAPSQGTLEIACPLGYSAIDLALYPQLSGHEHLELAGEFRGIESRSAELLESVGLKDAANVVSSRYSTGMRARLKLALALQHRPPLLLLDEPSAALDDDGRHLITTIVASQIAQGGAVILATNDHEDRRLATHEITLD